MIGLLLCQPVASATILYATSKTDSFQSTQSKGSELLQRKVLVKG